MEIKLYRSTAEENVVDKTNFIILNLNLEGTLKNETNIVNPSIEIEVQSDDLIYLLSTNYVYIPVFRRYYFVLSIDSIRTGLWRLNLKCDVLMSFKDNIKNVTALIKRNEFEFNRLIEDPLASFNYDKYIAEYVPLDGELVNTTFSPSRDLFENNFTLSVINDQISGTTYSQGVTSPIQNLLPDISSWTAGVGCGYRTYTSYITEMSKLSKYLMPNSKDTSNIVYSSYILSIMAFPFSLPEGTDVKLRLGSTELNDVTVQDLDVQLCKYRIIADFTIRDDDPTFISYNPYTTYQLWLPYCGWVNFNADDVLNVRIAVIYVVDYSTGLSQILVVDVTHKRILYTTTCQLGVSIPVNSTNAYEVNNNRLSNNIGLGLGLVGGAVSTGLGIASANPVAIAGGALSIANNVGGYITKTNSNYQRAIGSLSSGTIGLYAPQKVRVKIVASKPTIYYASTMSFNHLYGLPLEEIRTLSDMSGFTICSNFHLENFTTSTKNEIDEINNLLREGIIL